VFSILAVAALGLAASGVASYLVQRQGVLASVDSQLLHTVPDLKTIASGKTSDAPLTSVDSVLRVAMQQIIPASHESVLGFMDGKPALIPAVNLPFLIDNDSALVARIVSEANPALVVHRHRQEPARNAALRDHSRQGCRRSEHGPVCRRLRS